MAVSELLEPEEPYEMRPAWSLTGLEDLDHAGCDDRFPVPDVET